MTARQHTVSTGLEFIGVGLHSGRPAAVRVLPAGSGHGIRFSARGSAARPPLLASWRHVVGTRLCTTLGDARGARFATVEHLLAALAVHGVDNAKVEVLGGEAPILDGSARAYVERLASVPLRGQPETRPVLVIERAVGVTDGERFVIAAPAPGRRFTAEIEFPGTAIGHQRRSIDLDEGSFAREIAPARTFGFTEDLDRLQREGLARGGSRHNAVVLNRGEVLNPEGLRYQDEFVRHKLLDLVGDLALAGAPIVGHVFGFRPGHSLNTALVRVLLTTPGAASLRSSAAPGRAGADPLSELLAQPDLPAQSVWSGLLGEGGSVPLAASDTI